jgi:hypothetical protein
MGRFQNLIYKLSSRSSLRASNDSFPVSKNGSKNDSKNDSVATLHQLQLDNFRLRKDLEGVAKDRHDNLPPLPHSSADLQEVRYFLYMVLTHKAFGLTKICPQWVLETCWTWRGNGKAFIDLHRDDLMNMCPVTAGAAAIDPSKYTLEKSPSPEIREMIGKALCKVFNDSLVNEVFQPMFDKWNVEEQRSVTHVNAYHPSNGLHGSSFSDARRSTGSDSESGASYPTPASSPPFLTNSPRPQPLNKRAIASTSAAPHHGLASINPTPSQSGYPLRSEESVYTNDQSAVGESSKGHQIRTPSRYRRSSQHSLTKTNVTSIPKQDFESGPVSYEIISRLGGRHEFLSLFQDPIERPPSRSHQRGYPRIVPRHSSINDLPSQAHRYGNDFESWRRDASSYRGPGSPMYSDYFQPVSYGVASLEPIYFNPQRPPQRPDSRAGGPRWAEQPPSRVVFAREPVAATARPPSRVLQKSATKHEPRPASRTSQKSGVSQSSSNGRPLNNYCTDEFAAKQAEPIAFRNNRLSQGQEQMRSMSMQDLHARGSARKARASSGSPRAMDFPICIDVIAEQQFLKKQIKLRSSSN